MEIQLRSVEEYVYKMPGFDEIVEQTDNWAIGKASGLRRYRIGDDDRQHFHHEIKNPDSIPYGDVVRLESETASMKLTMYADIDPFEAPARADDVSTPDEDSLIPEEWVEITFSEVSLVSSKKRHGTGGFDESKCGYSIKFTDDYRIHLTAQSRVKSVLRILDSTQAKAPETYDRDLSLSEHEALALVRFLRTTRGEYVAHLPYDRRKPYYRACEGGAFLKKEANTGRKENAPDEELVETLSRARAVTVRPRTETPMNVWGTVHPEDSEIQ